MSNEESIKLYRDTNIPSPYDRLGDYLDGKSPSEKEDFIYNLPERVLEWLRGEIMYFIMEKLYQLHTQIIQIHLEK